MADDDEDIAALVVDNGSGMCKGKRFKYFSRTIHFLPVGLRVRFERSFCLFYIIRVEHWFTCSNIEPLHEEMESSRIVT